ncbi:hypothetical protein [Hyalangium rubrum]|uniref:Uncharacterized protein n=1 Tax=Hyalangium rubrum TaxID=3103134 RepID=A0ABU5GWL0_9BACT|nr:hypothetical protein [Hyalangium sp. s54d21]MDY7225074.1 hypothetical protein [Hyalangium sp. s54d21]
MFFSSSKRRVSSSSFVHGRLPIVLGSEKNLLDLKRLIERHGRQRVVLLGDMFEQLLDSSVLEGLEMAEAENTSVMQLPANVKQHISSLPQNTQSSFLVYYEESNTCDLVVGWESFAQVRLIEGKYLLDCLGTNKRKFYTLRVTAQGGVFTWEGAMKPDGIIDSDYQVYDILKKAPVQRILTYGTSNCSLGVTYSVSELEQGKPDVIIFTHLDSDSVVPLKTLLTKVHLQARELDEFCTLVTVYPIPEIFDKYAPGAIFPSMTSGKVLVLPRAQGIWALGESGAPSNCFESFCIDLSGRPHIAAIYGFNDNDTGVYATFLKGFFKAYSERTKLPLIDESSFLGSLVSSLMKKPSTTTTTTHRMDWVELLSRFRTGLYGFVTLNHLVLNQLAQAQAQKPFDMLSTGEQLELFRSFVHAIATGSINDHPSIVEPVRTAILQGHVFVTMHPLGTALFDSLGTFGCTLAEFRKHFIQ